MAAANPGKAQLGLMNKCVNCLVFNWGQPEDPTTLRKCKQCKVVQYCSESCQKEHWNLVHKKQCKKIASAIAFYREIGDDYGVSRALFLHHPFPALELQGNPKATLVMLALKVLDEMQFRNQSVYTKVSSKLAQLQAEMTKFMATTWANKKIFPEKFCSFCDVSEIYFLYTETSITADKELFGQDLWSTLHLVLGRLPSCDAVEMLNSLKGPREVVPAKLWIGLQQEVGQFPSRVAELIQALSGEQLPSYQELLKIFCGGNLSQACTFCSTRKHVVAVSEEVKGCFVGFPAVSILPFLPPLFDCGAKTCKEKHVSKTIDLTQLYCGLSATRAKLQSRRCDYCFMLAEKVHRCGECLTKNYCSRECLLKDSGENHSKFCHKGEEERKVKRDGKARVDAGMKVLEAMGEDGLMEPELMKLDCAEEVGKMVVEVKELCKKQEGKDKKKSEGGNSKRGRGQK